MKLCYNSNQKQVAVLRKLRSVISAVGAKVQEAPYKSQEEIPKICVFNTLAQLESPDGLIFSANTIIRYLADTHNNTLYGGDNAHNKALVDQWLDFTTTEFEPATRNIIAKTLDQQVDFGKLMEVVNKFLAAVEKHLSQRKFLVGESLSIADLSLAASISVVFGIMFGQGQRKKYPNTVAWYNSISGVNADVGPKDLPKQAHEAFKGGKKGAKKQQKKEQKKEQKADQDDDLFGDDDEAPAKPAPKPVVVKKEKKKAIAKSIITFDVKVYEQETDLHELFKKIKQIEMDGLVWNNEPKIIPVAFGMNKLQVGCVVQDQKISLDDIYEKIEEWQEVQSTDTVSFQKL